MSYQTGTATSSTDLLQKLVTFLVAAGWTQDMSQVEGVGWRAHLHKSGNYVHLRARENEVAFQQHNSGNSYGIDLYLGTGFNGAQPWNNQTTGAPVGSGASYPVGVGMTLSAGPFSNYYFFTDSAGDNVVVVVERTSGLFMHMGWGLSLNTAGTITGGAYFYGSTNGFWNTGSGLTGAGYTTSGNCPACNGDGRGEICAYVRADCDSFTGKWISIGPASTIATQGYTGKVGSSSVKAVGVAVQNNFPAYAFSDSVNEFQALQTSEQDGRVNLLPILLWVNRDSTSTGYSLLGSPPMVFVSNGVGNGFSNASEYAIGSDTYKLFPNFAVLKVP